MDWKFYTVIGIALCNILLGFLIYRKNRENSSNIWFFLMCLFGGIWGINKAFQLSVMDIYPTNRDKN